MLILYASSESLIRINFTKENMCQEKGNSVNSLQKSIVYSYSTLSLATEFMFSHAFIIRNKEQNSNIPKNIGKYIMRKNRAKSNEIYFYG